MLNLIQAFQFNGAIVCVHREKQSAWNNGKVLSMIYLVNFQIILLLEIMCTKWKSFYLKKLKLVYVLPSLVTVSHLLAAPLVFSSLSIIWNQQE